MVCPHCGAATHGIEEGNHVWCDVCGRSMRESPMFVVGFHQSHSARSQVYCRRKRFAKYIQRVCSKPAVLQNFYQILDLYSQYELVWTRTPSKRKYFFAKPVMLKVCCQMLDIDTEGLPALKDINREVDQAGQLAELRATQLWRLSYGVKCGAVATNPGVHEGSGDPY